MKSFIVVILYLAVSLCLALPVEKANLESVDADASGDLDAGHERLARGYGGYGGYPRYGGFGGGYPRYGGYGGYPGGGYGGYPGGGFGGGLGGGFGGASAQASSSASAFGGGLGGGFFG